MIRQKISGIFLPTHRYFFIIFYNSYRFSTIIYANKKAVINFYYEEDKVNYWTKKHWLRISLLALSLMVVAFLVWASKPLQAVEACCTNNTQVLINYEKKWLVIAPANTSPQTGLIFYPGGHVDYRSYNRPLSQIAQAGYRVIIVRMPLNLAVLGANQAADVIAAYPEIEHWVIGGHSLGGAMAARFVGMNPGLVQGLVLWGAYPPASVDLTAQADLSSLVIYGALDGLSTPEEVLASRAQFPPDTVFKAIEGGNHAQFGDYGSQKGDHAATITAESQQQWVVRHTLSFLQSLESEFGTP